MTLKKILVRIYVVNRGKRFPIMHLPIISSFLTFHCSVVAHFMGLVNMAQIFHIHHISERFGCAVVSKRSHKSAGKGSNPSPGNRCAAHQTIILPLGLVDQWEPEEGSVWQPAF